MVECAYCNYLFCPHIILLNDSRQPRKHTPGTVGKGFTMSAHVNFQLERILLRIRGQ